MENTEQQSQKSATGQMESNPRSLHTPGPWSVRLIGSSQAFGGSVNDVNGDQVALATVPRDGAIEARIANARLIAAAPELLAACRHADKRLDAQMFPKHSYARRSITAAIAKAEGAPSVQERNEVL